MEYASYIIINIATIIYNILNLYFFTFERKMNADSEKANGEEVQDQLVEDEPAVKAELIDKAEENPENVGRFDLPVGSMFLVFMFVMNIALANFITYLYDYHVALNIKTMFIVSALWPIAVIDFHTKKIPNGILKIMLVLRIAFLIPEFIWLDDMPHRLLSMAVAAVVVLISCVLCCVLIKGAIGMGDVKLFCIMAIYMGMDGIWSAIFCSLIASFFIAVCSLIRKKVNRKDNIPFAPAILIGTYLSVFLTGL